MNLELLVNRPLSKREKILFCLLFFCVILWVIIFAVIPKINEISDLKDELNNIKNEKMEYKQLYNNPKDYTNMLNQYEEIIKKIPKNIGLSEFLIDVEKWATEGDLSIISIYPRQIDNNAGCIAFDITLNGRFVSLLNFVDSLENHSRIVDICGIKLNTLSFSSNNFNSIWELLINVKLYFLE